MRTRSPLAAYGCGRCRSAIPASRCQKAELLQNNKYIASTYKEVKEMKEGIHPQYYQATVTCNCGNTFVTGSTKPEIHVEVCSKCHSFYTGQMKTARADGRIEKFNKKYGVQ